jgi:release factor glutamine methyltransferase
MITPLKAVEKKLKAVPVLSPRAEAETLVCHFGKTDRLGLFTSQKDLSKSAKLSIERALAERRRGIPLAHLTGQAPFFGHFFCVTKDVLIPRPETERLVEEALRILNAHFRGKKPSVLDLGTGSGCVP